jgi:hypothetical protein
MPEARCIAVFLCILFALVIVVSPVSAKVVTYDGKGSAGTIQDVINNATNGDSIFLAGGTYYGNFVIDRSLVFGALDSDDPPIMVSSGSGAGLTLSADGITINGVTIAGNASYGILVLSNNNRISSTTVVGHAHGLELKSASNNIFSDNTITGNSVGVDVDRMSQSNTFFLNSFNNSVDAISQSAGTAWFSARQDYQYQGKDFSGPLGNFWAGAGETYSTGDGVGDELFTIASAGKNSPGGAVGITDPAPLVSPPLSYKLTKSALAVNASPLGGLEPPAGFQSSLQPDNAQASVTSGSSQSPFTGALQSGKNPQGQPPNPLVGFLIQFWWLIPVALLISAAGGIWFERYRRKGQDHPLADQNPYESRNATVVKKPADASLTGEHGQDYAIHLPAALERKYPDAEYIAEGGVSRVFRVWDETNNRYVAVKVPIRFDEVTGTQFTKELTIWEGLHHKNIVELYGANIFPRPYIEMEYVASSLAEMHFPIDEKKAAVIITGIAEGLRYAHDQGIVHRDIKPGNILLTPEGMPKITDWGLSKAQGTKQSGLIGFSLEYAAPEQLAPNIYGEPGPWTDIYQMGVLFYEMLAGHVPFAGDGMGEVTHAILHDEPAPAISEGRNADAVNAIIEKCLRKRPQDRYTSVAELLKDLEGLDLAG